jgi:putative heme degradation protein
MLKAKERISVFKNHADIIENSKKVLASLEDSCILKTSENQSGWIAKFIPNSGDIQIYNGFIQSGHVKVFIEWLNEIFE